MDNTDQLNIEIESDNNSNNKSSVDEWDEEMQELQEPDIEEINNDDVDNESMDNSTILNEVKSNIDESKVTEVEKANETTTNRRLSGRSNIGKSSHYADEDFEYEDTKYELPDFLRIAEVPLRKYYSDRLLQVIFLLRGNEDSLKGWKVQIEYESKGVMTGLIEVYYVNNRKKKCRNRVEVASFLGLLPPVKNLKNMSRDQLYLIAMETREKHLISQLVLASNGLCDEIRYINDNAFITYHLNAIKYSLSSTKVPEVLIKPDDSESKVSNSQSKTNENLFFAFGNTTVISWGNINSTTQFHNNKYLIPLGFKCIRQEYDMLLDKIVDCLCEISSITETTSSGTTTSPLFRLTVSWQLNNGTFHPRVYEAKSPQQAWQAAMLEKLGSVSDSEDNELLSLDLITTSKFEDFDEEEKLLRNKIREERRVYFRSLRNEQKQGIQGAVKPRLNIENVETFIDDSILRFIEGMQGVLDCHNYVYLDLRDKDNNIYKNLLKSYVTSNDKMKNLYTLFSNSESQSNGSNNAITINTSNNVLKPNIINDTMISDSSNIKPIIYLRKKQTKVTNFPMNNIMKLDHKNQISIYQKLRSTKIRKIESNIIFLRNNILKTIRKKRDKTKLHIENLSNFENKYIYYISSIKYTNFNDNMFLNNLNIDSNFYLSYHISSQDLLNNIYTSINNNIHDNYKDFIHKRNNLFSSIKSSNFILIDGNIFYNLLELYDFLYTFNSILNIINLPTFEKFVISFKKVDPIVQQLLTTCPFVLNSKINLLSESSNEFSNNVSQILLNVNSLLLDDDNALELINNIGIALTKCLISDYKHYMNISPAETQIGSVYIPVNALTWHEVSRVILLASSYKQVGISDADISTLLKGKGFCCTPETIDRKALRLTKKRLLYNYSIRNEFQESNIGFQYGLTVRLPKPSYYLPSLSNNVYEFLYYELDKTPTYHIWMIRDIIYLSMSVSSLILPENTYYSSKISQSFKYCLTSPIFDIFNAEKAKLYALAILKYLLNNSLESFDIPEDKYMNTVPLTAHELIERQLRYNFMSVHPNQLLQRNDSDILVDNEFENDMIDEENLINNNEIIEKNIERDDTPIDHLERHYQDIERQSSTNNLIGSNNANNDDIDLVEIEKLSIPMQRCYFCIQNLMNHELSSLFQRKSKELSKNLPIFIYFNDIRLHVINGLYNNSIFSFYIDVILVFNNLFVYHTDSYISMQLINRYVIIFERMFYEMVLTWDNPLPCHDACVVCRINPYIYTSTLSKDQIMEITNNGVAISQSSLSQLMNQSTTDLIDISTLPQDIYDNISTITKANFHKYIICERCESYTHLGCLDPPLLIPPRTEWYCSGCIESKSIANVHINKTAYVISPNNNNSYGQVVGIEQIKQTLRFIVEFDNKSREIWSGNQVRHHILSDEIDTIISDSRNESTNFSLYHLKNQSFPFGYDYNDYDAVCGVAKGYTTWGNTYLSIPPNLLHTNSIYSIRKSLIDPYFTKNCLSIGYLSLLPEDLYIKEYINIFYSLKQKLLISNNPSIINCLNIIDETNGEKIVTCYNNIKNNIISYDKLISSYSNGKPNLSNKLINKAINNTQTSNTDTDSKSIAPKKLKRKPNYKFIIRKTSKNKKTIEVDTDAIYEDDFYDAYMDGDMDPMEVDNGSDLDIDLENDDAIYDSDFEDLYNAPVDSNKQISNSTTNKPTDANTNSANSNIESKDTALLTKRRSILHDWEQRRLSRRRGREDCLMNQSLLVDIFNTTDVYGFEEKDEYGNIIENILGSFYQTLAPSLIKSLVIRTPDDMILEEWMLGFDNKSHDLTSSKNTIFETCAFCGKEENFIASSFVWGQTWCEFIDEKFNKSINASNDINNTTVNNNNHIDKDIDIDINPTSNDYDDIIDKTNDQFGQELEEPIVRRGRYAKLIAAKALIYKPCSSLDVEVEDKERKVINRSFTTGSLKVHEYCAELMQSYRDNIYKHNIKLEDQRIADILAGIGRCKTTSIGKDNDRNIYWVFGFSKCLYICSESSGLDPTDAVNSSKADNYYGSHISDYLTSLSNQCSYNSQTNQPNKYNYYYQSSSTSYNQFHENLEQKKTIWHVLSTDQDISEVLQWLDKKDPNERLIHRALSLLYPEAYNISISANTTSTSNLNKQEEKSVNDIINDLTTSEHLSDHHHTNNLTTQPKFNIGENVQVKSVTKHDLYWEATILYIDNKVSNPLQVLYFIKFHDLTDNYNSWISESDIIKSLDRNVNNSAVDDAITNSKTNNKSDDHNDSSSDYSENSQSIPIESKVNLLTKKETFLQQEVLQGTNLLRTLKAYIYMNAPHRHFPNNALLSYSNTKTSIDILKTSLLMLYNALPYGAVDEAEDKWGDNFHMYWRENVLLCNDVNTLMQCLILFEYGLRTPWILSNGLKLLSCLPSRSQCLRNPTIGLIALKIWILDQSIKYDKLLSKDSVKERNKLKKKSS